MRSDPDSISTARRLLRTARHGALATLTRAGAPYGSLLAVASHPNGSPILLVSRLALHTKNILADPRLSLLLYERAAGDPLQQARIMLAGVAEQARSEEAGLLRRRYLAAHPNAALFVDFPDFLFFHVRITGVHLVAGFGRIADMESSQLVTDLSNAGDLIAAEEDAIAHMNQDHRDTLSLYATKLLGGEAADWRCSGLDPEGLDLAVDERVLRLNFPERVTSSAALRQVLVKLAAAARGEATGRR